MFFNTLSLSEALDISLSNVNPLQASEHIHVTQSLGRILSTSVVSSENLPGFDRSSMDGYAVLAEDTYGASDANPKELKLVGRIDMGQDASVLPALQNGEAIGISTGGMLPPGADAIVIIEETELEGDQLIVLKPAAPGTAVIRADEDFKQGEQILPVGHRIRAQDIGAFLGVGITQIDVLTQLQVGVISTGDELVPPEQKVTLGQVRDINSYTTAAQIRELGATPISYGIVVDQRKQLADAVSQGLAECDAVLISGGSSVGVRDATMDILDHMGEVFVHGIRVAPGKPTIFAMCGDKPVIGLPGNPVSSMVVFEIFVAPILLKRSGSTQLKKHAAQVRAILSKSIPSAKGRDDFVRVKLSKQDDITYAEPIYAHSNNISSLSKADGILPIPADVEGFARDESVVIELW